MADGISAKIERYVFIDALRGIAAVAVLFRHLLHNTDLEDTLRRVLPVWMQFVSSYGARGVQIFFVISGFVIAHSLRATPRTPRALGNFILRRQLRLDPPYWTIIVLTLLLPGAVAGTGGFVGGHLAAVRTFVMNLFYLQNVTGSFQIVSVAWTLCLEIQFYLFFIAILSIGAFFKPSAAIVTAIVLVTGLCSMGFAIAHRGFDPWFMPYWMYFAGGCLCYWSFTHYTKTWVFITFALLFAMATAEMRTSDMVVGLATLVVLFSVGKIGHLSNWLGGSVPQYFGRISYSLYLVHLPIVALVMREGYKLTHTNKLAALGWLLVAAGCSIMGAHILYCLVEKPSMRLASKLKSRPVNAPVPTQDASRTGGALVTSGEMGVVR